jgi:alpha-tubulin suppressor-like RCC1 family protein
MYASYCILENNQSVNDCVFQTGLLPSTFRITPTPGSKVLSVWIKDRAGNIGNRVDSQSITYDPNATASLTLATVTNSNPSQSRYYRLSYGTITGDYSGYCILENNTNPGSCSWISGKLPETYLVNANNNSKVLSIWLRDDNGNFGTRVDTNAVSYDSSGTAAVAISTASESTCSVNQSGAVDCWGQNDNNQYKTIDTTLPVTLKDLTSNSSTEIGLGDGYGCATRSGKLFCWGQNGNAGVSSYSPIQMIPSGVSGLAVGQVHLCAIISGSVQCWGYNDYGQVGAQTQGQINFSRMKTVVPSGATQVAVNRTQSCAIVNGDLQCWGYNGNGSLGLSGDERYFTPQTILSGNVTHVSMDKANSTTCAVQNGAVKCWGYLWIWGTWQSSPRVLIASGATKVSVGANTICAVVSGALKCTGAGPLGDGTNGWRQGDFFTTIPSGVSDVVLGSDNSGCALVGNDLKCWGRNDYGQIGNSSLGTTALTPITVLSGGVSRFALYGSSTCAAQSGLLKCWGNNQSGKLGLGRTDIFSSPQRVIESGATAVATARYHTCAIVNGGDLQCWGTDPGCYGNIGNGQCKPQPTPVTILSGGVTDVSAQYLHSCAIQNGALYCWGFNGNGQLGTGDWQYRLAPTLVPGMESGVTAIAVSNNSSCAIKNGGLYCWGSNDQGQIGIGSQSGSYLSPVQIFDSGASAVTTGMWNGNTCAIVNSALYCWGTNYWNQLGGIGGDSYITSPRKVVDLDPNHEWKVSYGYAHTLLLDLTTGALQAWGVNWWGQVGTYASTPGSTVTYLNTNVTAAAAGSYHSCAIKDGKVYCWGQGGSGQNGRGLNSDGTPSTYGTSDPQEVIF